MSRYISNSHVCEIHGRGEWSRVYDACMVVRVYFPRLRASCMPRLTYVCPRRLKTRHPYHLGGVFWYGSSISIIIYLSLIRGISSVADGENVCFKLALKQGFSALVTVISLIYSAVCVAGSCLDLQQPAVEPFLSSTGLLLVFLRPFVGVPSRER